MKNILITSTTRENQGTSLSFVKDINDITDPDLRELVIKCLTVKTWNKNGYWVYDGTCGCDNGGYIFNDYVLLKKNLPVTVEHIVEYLF